MKKLGMEFQMLRPYHPGVIDVCCRCDSELAKGIQL